MLNSLFQHRLFPTTADSLQYQNTVFGWLAEKTCLGQKAVAWSWFGVFIQPCLY